MADPSRPTLARLVATQAYSGLPDHALLARFATDRDEVAFAALVERHGPVVFDVALAVLRQTQDAEDTYQATFLVLARKAATIRKGTSIGCWLHGVARRLALKVLRARTRRTRHEPAVCPNQPQPTGDDLTWGEVRGLIHEELARLPETLRAPVILCHLEGLTQDEAATQLGLPKGTLKGRLERGRAVLRSRLARRGLALAAATFPVSLARAVPPLLILDTARSASRFAAGAELTTRAAELANGALHAMIPTQVKLCLLLLAVAIGAVGLFAAPGDNPPEAKPAPGDNPSAPTTSAPQGNPPVATAPAPRESKPMGTTQPPALKSDFEKVTIVIKPPGLSPPGSQPATVTIGGDGTCLYEVAGIPANGTTPAWTAARIIHKLPPERLRRLNGLLKDTEWLTKATAKGDGARIHSSEYVLTLKRGGETTTVSFPGEPKVYEPLLQFLNSVARQENLLYRMEWVPEAMLGGRRELDGFVRAELGEPQGKAPFEIDLARYTPWAIRLVREPFGKTTDDVAAGVRLVGLLKLESEREYLADLASDRDFSVRIAVARALGRLGGEKSVPVLRKMLRSTTSEAAWELIKLGPIAVPTIAEVIRDGTDPQDRSYEWLIRAFIEHWKEIPKPLDAKILEAVQTSMSAPKVKGDRTVYHKELLKLAPEKERKE